MSVSLVIIRSGGERTEVLVGSYGGIEKGWRPIATKLGLQILPEIQDWIRITPGNLPVICSELNAFQQYLRESGDPAWATTIEVAERMERELLTLSRATGWSAEIG